MPLSCKSGNISICAIEYDAAQWDELRSLNAADDHLRIGCCDSQVTLITSKLGTRFFAHRRRGACTSAPETAEHLLVKEIIARAIAGTGWTVATEVRGNTPDGGLWTADVLAERGKHRIAFEVQWSPQNQEETAQRQERYRNSGVRGLWLMSRPSGLQISKEVPSLLVQVDLDTRTANIKIPAMESMGLTDHSARNADFLWSQQIELGRFVRGCLSRKFIWAPGLNDRVPLEISSVKQDCWKCHKPTSIITSLEFRVDLVVPGAKPIALGLADFDTPEGLPILAQALEQTDLRKYGIGDIRRRYSRTRGMAYLSNGCVHCDALQGAFFEHDIGHDAEPTLTIQCDMPEALFNESTHGARMMWAFDESFEPDSQGLNQGRLLEP